MWCAWCENVREKYFCTSYFWCNIKFASGEINWWCTKNNPSFDCSPLKSFSLQYLAVAAGLEEKLDENVYKSFYLSGVSCFMTGQYSNHKSLLYFKVDLWERGNWKEELFWGFYKFGFVIPCYKKPDHPLPLSKTTLAAQRSRSKKWPSNYCDWKSIQELCNTLQCSLAPFFHWKLPNEYLSLNL